MPTKSVVRIDGKNGVVGGIIVSAAAGNSTTSSLSTAGGTGGEDNVGGTGQVIIAAAKSEKNDSANDTTTTTTKESQEDEDNENQEVCNVALVELVSPSKTSGGQSPATKLPRREDFNSALEYLEAKYVKSIVVQDEITDSPCWKKRKYDEYWSHYDDRQQKIAMLSVTDVSWRQISTPNVIQLFNSKIRSTATTP